ncbi:hypothetical protein BSKO_01986 [Bryopsis sp. KO-2023]|nr:hypothetical protein BSKO_01986 [Bryopsis sp. KO-2023]
MEDWDQYTWVVVLGAFTAFFTAYGIGANDVANAFASSVGSKALTLTQAVIIGAIFEFGGAVLLGSQVTDTVRKKIADKSAFAEDPEVLMYGFLCVLLATGIWLLLATFLELPVSTTHSVIGGIIGMSLVAHGSDAVVWYKYDSSKEALKKFSGVVPVIISWVVSPLLSGLAASFLFYTVRMFILRSPRSFERSLIFFPFLVGVTIAVNAYFIIYKGFSRKVTINGEKKKLHEHLGPLWSSVIAWGLGAIIGLVLHFAFVPWLRKRGLAVGQAAAAKDNLALEDTKPEGKEGVEGAAATQAATGNTANKALTMLDKDLHSIVKSDDAVQNVHDNAENFAVETEEAFRFLQVFTAMCDSFAHGANDVANSIGPFAGIYGIYNEMKVESKSEVPIWILVLGGFGIVVGLATYGHTIIRAIGVKLTKISPSRGFTIELGSATIIIIGSRYGIPLSTTHCQVGATVGVGLLEGVGGVNGMLFLKVIGGWLITLVVVGFTSAAFFAQAIYAPSIPNLRTIARYEQGVFAANEDLIAALGTDTIEGIDGNASELNAEYDELNIDTSAKQLSILSPALAALIDTCSA